MQSDKCRYCHVYTYSTYIYHIKGVLQHGMLVESSKRRRREENGITSFIEEVNSIYNVFVY